MKTDKERTKDMFQEISQNANAGVINPEKVKEEIKMEHRFLQNEIFYSLIVPMIKGLSDCGFDRRNKQSVKEARQMLENLEE